MAILDYGYFEAVTVCPNVDIHKCSGRSLVETMNKLREGGL